MSDWQRSQLQCRHEGRQNWLHAKKGHSLNDMAPVSAPVEKEGQNGGFFQGSKLTVWTQNDRIFFLSSNACFGGHFPNTGERTASIRDRPRSSAKEKAIPTSAIESTEQTFSSECQTGNVPSCSVVTKAARTGCTPKKGHSLNDKAPVEKEGQNGGFSKALN